MSEAAVLAVGVPTIVAGLLDACLSSVVSQEWVAHDVVVLCNGAAAEPACAEWERRGLEVRRPGDNLGVAASWNVACRRAWDRGRSAVVLLNDDVTLLDRFAFFQLWSATRAEPRRLYFLDASHFAAFCVTRVVWEELGEFDEGFWPGYYEDLDYLRRARCSGIGATELGVECRHVGGGSRSGDPELLRVVEHTFGINAQRYEAKWGGPPDAEVFDEPWNGGRALPGVRELSGL